jgi:tetratricopeptide (TPR) repeat protein
VIRIQYVPPSTGASTTDLPTGHFGAPAEAPAVQPFQLEQAEFARTRASKLGFEQVGLAGRARKNERDTVQLSREWRALASKAGGPWQVLHDATTRLDAEGRPNAAALRQAQARLHQWIQAQAAGKKLPPELEAQAAKVDALVARMLRRNAPLGELPVTTAFQTQARAGWRQAMDKVLPKAPEALTRQAQKLWKEGRSAEALDLLEDAAEKHPTHAKLQLELGRMLTEEGFFPEAEWKLVDLATEHPRHPEVQAALGELYMQMGQPLLAAEAFKQTLKLDPNHTDAHLQLGVTLYEQGDLENAAPHLQRAIRLDQMNAVARFYMAQISLQENDVLRARYQLGMVAKLAPHMDLTRFGENAPPPLTSRTGKPVTEPPAHHWQLPQVRQAKTSPLDASTGKTRKLDR